MKKGDNVAYSVQWLKSIGESHGPLAHARGHVQEIMPVGSTLKLALVDWNDDEIPKRVNVQNLALVGPNTRFCQC